MATQKRRISYAVRGDAMEGCEHLNWTTRAEYPARTTDLQLQPPTTTAAPSTIADSKWRATHPVYDGVRRPMNRQSTTGLWNASQSRQEPVDQFGAGVTTRSRTSTRPSQ